MFNYFNAYYLFVKTLLVLLLRAIGQYLFYLFFISKHINSKFKNADESLSKKDKKRIVNFSIIFPMWISYNYQLLKREKLTKHQLKIITLVCAITPLFDDFFDDKNLSLSSLEGFLKHPNAFTPSNSKEKLLHYLYTKLEPLLTDKHLFLTESIKLFHIQHEAQLQKGKEVLSVETIKEITFKKGGLPIVLFEKIVCGSKYDNADALSYQLGGIMQYSDDVFDLWFDVQDGTQTLANSAMSINQLKQDFTTEFKKFIELSKNQKLSSTNHEKFVALQFFLVSTVFVAFKQLEVVVGSDEKFVAANYKRHELVCDMSKFKNLHRWVMLYANLLPQFQTLN